ncbi:MAG: NAD(P)H-dependent glycerol-3-phosphate dehydrogenase [Verrucomicrobiales bacterium]|nr:NAD(P)H-dependent glycerol-3-phosphate dehydrogenase [Verrucomicrobiales bacterium]MCP5558276.1 NAD(P)H-dependent glycerol-3-phosphate dehydrogenase [Verrucomicrobiaceae bacterium]
MSDAPSELTSAIVLGAGSWGTALASMLAERGLDVQFWGRSGDLMADIAATRINSRYLPGLTLQESVHCTSDLNSLSPADMLLFTVPSKGIREIAHRLGGTQLSSKARVQISCAKGVELNTGLRMSQILSQELPAIPVAVLTGPNHAEEAAARLATAAVVACADEMLARRIQACFTLPWFRTYTTLDIVGAEWGGAMKNPYAIAAGICHGLKLGDNASAALVTRALAEILRVGLAQGGRPETFYGLSGVGDLMATCYSEHSRNHRVGLALGRGEKLADIIAGTNMVAEGVPNTASLHQAARACNVRTPLLDEIYAILYEEKSPKAAMRDLLSRDPRAESD